MRITKKTRQTWIIGKYINDQDELHFPPVVPWINNDLQHELTKLFMVGIRGDMGEVGRQMQALEREIKQIESLNFISPVQKRRLKKFQADLEELERQAGVQQERLVSKARNEVLMLSLIRGLRAVEIKERLGRPCAVFITAPVIIRKVVLGTYDVWFDPTRSAPSSAFFLRRRDYIQEQGPHPHWMGYGCLGTFGPIFKKMLERHDYGSLVGAFLKYLAIYDPGSPLMQLGRFNEGGYRNEKPLA